MYSLVFLKKAKDEFSRIDPVWQTHIKAKLELLVRNPLVLKNNISVLKGKYKGLARLRVGPYRVVFQKKEQELIILIIRIASRSNVYK